MTIDGDTLTATDEFIVDAASHIKLDSDSGNIIFRDAGSNFSKIINSAGHVLFSVETQDKNINFNGNDGGAAITALTLDMSEAGTAIFNHDIQMSDLSFLRMGAGGDLIAYSDGTHALINANNGNLSFDVAGDMIIDVDGGDIYLNDGGTGRGQISMANTDLTIISATSDRDLIFKGVDGGSVITALTLDMSNAGAATFNNAVSATGFSAASGGALVTRVGRSLTSNSVANVNFYDAGASTFPGHVHIVANSSGSDSSYNSGDIRFWHFDGSAYNSIAAFNKNGGLAFGTDQAAANTLDDYEEGTYTATVGNSTNMSSLSFVSARYVKVGKLVHFEFEVGGGFSSSGTESSFSITLPFLTATTTTVATGMFSFFKTAYSQDRFSNGQIFQGTTQNGAIYVYIGGSQLPWAGNFGSAKGTFTYQSQ